MPACSPADSATIVVLAGGESSRFGTNKALVPWNKRGTILDNVIEKALKAYPDVALSVKRAGDYPDKHLKKFPDVVRGKGPLGGLYSAFLQAEADWMMILACDMPLIDSSLLRYMLGIRTWAPVIIPFCRGRFEPLHAIYHRSLLPIVEYLIETERLRMKQLLDLVPKRLVLEDEIEGKSDCLRCFCNINTVSDLEEFIHGTGLEKNTDS